MFGMVTNENLKNYLKKEQKTWKYSENPSINMTSELLGQGIFLSNFCFYK